MSAKNKMKTIGLFPVLFLCIATGLLAQQPQLPKNVNQPKQVIVPTKPLINKDSVRYVAAPTTVTANNRIATADEIYIQNGSFIIRTARDYRYLHYPLLSMSLKFFWYKPGAAFLLIVPVLYFLLLQ